MPHAKAFALTARCPDCQSDPGPEPRGAAPMAVRYPRGCPKLEEVWRSLGEDLAELLEVRTELRGKKAALERAERTRGRGREPKTTVMDPHLANAIVKVQDAITKLRRLQRELAERHYDDAITNAMLEEKRRSTSSRGGRN